jgi:hypothetical protein
MKIILALIAGISFVLAIEHVDYSNNTSHASGNLRQKVSINLEIDYQIFGYF